MNVDHLLDAADRLATQGARPREVDLRRAVSNAYYAVFHCAARAFADCLVGATKRRTTAWAKVYRGVEHAKAKDEFKRNDVKAIDPAISTFAIAFIELQEARHVADYDPQIFPFARRQVKALIAQARTAITGLRALDTALHVELATIIFLKRR